MDIPPLGAKLFHADRRTNGRTDMAKLIFSSWHFANAPKNGWIGTCSKGSKGPNASQCSPILRLRRPSCFVCVHKEPVGVRSTEKCCLLMAETSSLSSI